MEQIQARLEEQARLEQLPHLPEDPPERPVVHVIDICKIPQICITAIPEFEGEESSLALYLDAAEAFLSNYQNQAVPNDPGNTWLVRIVCSKLTGRARALIGSGVNVTRNWYEIRDLLIRHFSDHRDENNLVYELQNMYIRGGEKYEQFGCRIQEIRRKIDTKIKLSKEGLQVKLSKVLLYDQTALQTYIRNLRDPIHSYVRQNNPTNLEEAISLTISEENYQMYLNNFRKNNFGNQRPQNNPRNNFRRNNQQNYRQNGQNYYTNQNYYPRNNNYNYRNNYQDSGRFFQNRYNDDRNNYQQRNEYRNNPPRNEFRRENANRSPELGRENSHEHRDMTMRTVSRFHNAEINSDGNFQIEASGSNNVLP